MILSRQIEFIKKIGEQKTNNLRLIKGNYENKENNINKKNN